MRKTNSTRSKILSILALLGVAAACMAESPAPVQSEPITIFLIDDQTGEELAAKHGIYPLTTSDLDVLINAVLQRNASIRLFCGEVVEDASATVPVDMKFRPFAGGSPPIPPAPSLPLRQLVEEMKAYREKRALWQNGILEYRKELVTDVERFVRQVTELQMTTAKRFDDELKRRNGHDFNRSDVVGSVVTANRMLGAHGKRLLVLNTDAEDEPAKRRPRTTPLTATELDPGTELIWVNKSRIPDSSPLFKGLPNHARHADTLREAMELVIDLITQDGSKQIEAQPPRNCGWHPPTDHRVTELTKPVTQ